MSQAAASPDDPAASPWEGPRRIGELLVAAGAVTPGDIELALRRKQRSERLGDTVVRLGMCSEDDISNAVADRLRLSRVDVSVVRPQREAIALVAADVAERLDILPLRIEHGILVVATADPDVGMLDDLRLLTRARHVRAEIAAATPVRVARRRAYRRELTLRGPVPQPTPEEPSEPVDEHSVVQLLDRLVTDAIESRASDLHFEPDPRGLRVRMRVDGMLREVAHLPTALAPQVVSRIKILAELDISERRLPQDGRAGMRTPLGEVDLRVATMPTLYGEKAVLRLLARGGDRIRVGSLGLSADTRTRFVAALTRPQGLVLVTGPTGSGKTTTLYAGLAAIVDETRNVLTLEDPIEYELEGVNQTQVDPRIGLTFASGLRHLLRQDPDVVLVGEIRDQETAQLAVEAAMTGHLVLASMHTNDAASSVARLVDLGADPFLVRASLLLVLGQRLLRTVCTGCATPDTPSDEALGHLGLGREDLAGATPMRGRGCLACDDAGERGRIAASELLSVGPELRGLLSTAVSEDAIAAAARGAGMRTLREDALARAYRGEVTFDEVLRTTPDASGDPRSLRGGGCPAPAVR